MFQFTKLNGTFILCTNIFSTFEVEKGDVFGLANTLF